MTDARMIRALERGGCAIARPDANWDVRRTLDARSSTIGQLQASTVTALRRAGELKRLGDYYPVRLVCVSGESSSVSISRVSADILANQCAPMLGGPLVERAIRAVSSSVMRDRLCEAIEAYREDMLWAAQAGSIAGMNWSGLALGTLIDTTQRPDRSLSTLCASQAGRRLQRVAECFGSEPLRQLNSMVMDEVTRNRFSETFGISRRRVEAKAQAHLHRLSDVYQKAVSAPDRLAE